MVGFCPVEYTKHPRHGFGRFAKAPGTCPERLVGARAKTASGGNDALGKKTRSVQQDTQRRKRAKRAEWNDRTRRTNAGSLTVDASPEMIAKDQLEAVQG